MFEMRLTKIIRQRILRERGGLATSGRVPGTCLLRILANVSMTAIVDVVIMSSCDSPDLLGR